MLCRGVDTNRELCLTVHAIKRFAQRFIKMLNDLSSDIQRRSFTMREGAKIAMEESSR